MLAPESVAIVGLSADPTKHGGRVLANLRKVGFPGAIWGVNPRRPDVAGVEVFASLTDLPSAPDLVVCAVPAAVIPATVRSAGEAGAGGVVVFAGGFAEAGGEGSRLQDQLAEAATAGGVRVLGPNSGGLIRPAAGLAASFLTCLDRPPDQIRPGPVGLVTQSGGTGSYVHNLAAAAGGGLAASISTGNEADLGLADGIRALTELDDVVAIALVMETVRDGAAFVAAVREARGAGKPVVACRIGTSRRGEQLMSTHTGAMAAPARVLDGVLDSLGVTVAETPEEMLAVAEVMARTGPIRGDRVGVVTHSGGIAILLTDLAERRGVTLPHPSDDLRNRLEPLLQLGSSDNPLDMGGIIGGPGRFGEVVDLFAGSDDFDVVLAVSTAHPPAHTLQRVRGLLAAAPTVPVVHLWMAGDVGAEGLDMLRAAGRPVTTEPRAAMRALAGLARLSHGTLDPPAAPPSGRLDPVPRTEHEAKVLLSEWGLPVVEGGLARSAAEAVELASRIGGSVAMKVSAPGLIHKTEVGGVVLGVDDPDRAGATFERLVSTVSTLDVDGVRIERMAAGVEVIVGMVTDPLFGPMALVGLGGVAAEGLGAERLVPAPVSHEQALRTVATVPGLEAVLSRRTDASRALEELAKIVEQASVRFVVSGLAELEMNPIAWTGNGWEILDAVMVARPTEGGSDGSVG